MVNMVSSFLTACLLGMVVWVIIQTEKYTVSLVWNEPFSGGLQPRDAFDISLTYSAYVMAVSGMVYLAAMLFVPRATTVISVLLLLTTTSALFILYLLSGERDLMVLVPAMACNVGHGLGLLLLTHAAIAYRVLYGIPLDGSSPYGSGDTATMRNGSSYYNRLKTVVARRKGVAVGKEAPIPAKLVFQPDKESRQFEAIQKAAKDMDRNPVEMTVVGSMLRDISVAAIFVVLICFLGAWLPLLNIDHKNLSGAQMLLYWSSFVLTVFISGVVVITSYQGGFIGTRDGDLMVRFGGAALIALAGVTTSFAINEANN